MQETSAAVIVAAGSSRRMQGRDKLWLSLAGRVTLAHTIDTFQASPLIDTIVIVTNAERLADVDDLCQREQWQKIIAVVPGGARRQDSVRHGLDELARQVPTCRWVMIHDAARPFVTQEILAAGLQAAQEHQAAIAAVPVKDTIKQVRKGIITETPDRALLWAVQTPQVFAFPLIHQAHHTPLAQEDMTDDATLLERLGHAVAVFPGSYTNIKITTQEDLLFAEVFIKGQTR
ncbi:2-C-methyl-D-erythritol 4-phosphate cytidylyltransferase [Ktedonobacter sp. SOSP1-52]|uniref:2-C-methyl-D-erythritol 4-phosphate cytidylyltransferase n=1 Tax=Ktedonobacter sp. SOSP1-52 TaxID=2778366 RepID=UPI001916375C|nr:2-C-methyl-D-erythritol 4-phosphate cytidylyltransferase [Ktedonobacter sp. SOSP1-52]GHO67025.1 2-C-methyl-D-erythritol 4-phosphate cytidylyltransferase [Ktedonobacter sp. SOSP1-52]